MSKGFKEVKVESEDGKDDHRGRVGAAQACRQLLDSDQWEGL